MNTTFKAKFLNHLTQRKNSEKGFTLIELLVVIIIIGILSAIALPAFLNQANKAKQSEAKQYVGALSRSQQAYYLEKSEFATNFDQLGKPVASQTENYTYPLTATNVVGKDTLTETVNMYGTSRKVPLKSYVGAVALDQVGSTSEATTTSILCEAKSPGKTAAATQTQAAVVAQVCTGATINVGK